MIFRSLGLAAVAWLAAALFCVSPAWAQAIVHPCYYDTSTPPVCIPIDAAHPLPTNTSATVTVGTAPSTNPSGTVTTSFVSIQASNTSRKGCLIQNQSTGAVGHEMWVFFGAIGSATQASAFQLDAIHGMQISCQINGITVASDQVSIKGTNAGDVFVASFQ